MNIKHSNNVKKNKIKYFVYYFLFWGLHARIGTSELVPRVELLRRIRCADQK